MIMTRTMRAAALAAALLAAAPAAAKTARHHVTDAEFRTILEQRLVAEDERSDGAITALKTNLPEGYKRLLDDLVDDRRYVNLDSPGDFQAQVRQRMMEIGEHYMELAHAAPVPQARAVLAASTALMKQMQSLEPEICANIAGHVRIGANYLQPETFKRLGDAEAAVFVAARAAMEHPSTRRALGQEDARRMLDAIGDADIEVIKNLAAAPPDQRCKAMIDFQQAVAGMSDADAEPWFGVMWAKRAS
jgi:hypothetical protein